MNKLKAILANPTIKRILSIVQSSMKRVNIGVESAAMTYFILLSVFPILLVIANVIPLLPIPVDEVLALMDDFVPEDISSMLTPIIKNYLGNVNGGVISVGLITLIWPASKVFNGIQNALNKVYGAPPLKNFILTRLFSFLVALVSISVLGLVNFAFVFGEQILRMIENFFRLDLSALITDFGLLRWIVFALVILAFMSLVYHLIPNVRWPFRYAVPGGVFTTIGFVLISQLFTIYVAMAGSNISANGAFGGVIVFMIWLYFSSMVFLYGAFLNMVIYRYRHPENNVEKYMPSERMGEEWVYSSHFDLETLKRIPLNRTLVRSAAPRVGEEISDETETICV